MRNWKIVNNELAANFDVLCMKWENDTFTLPPFGNSDLWLTFPFGSSSYTFLRLASSNKWQSRAGLVLRKTNGTGRRIRRSIR